MVAPPDNDVLWARSLHYSPQRLARAHRRLPRCARGRDPRRRRPARQRQDDPAALPVRPARAAAGRGLVQQPARAHPGPAGPRTAAPRPLRLDRPRARRWSPSSTPGRTRPCRCCCAARRAARPRPPPWSGWSASTSARCARKRPYALLQAQRQRVAIARALVPAPAVLFADEPTAPLHRARPRAGAAYAHHGGPLARDHRRAGHARRGGRGPRRPHGVAARRPSRRNRPLLPSEAEGRAACSLSV